MWIERYEPCWHSQVIELATVVFGEGYFSEPWLQTRQPDSMMFLAHDDIDGLYGFAHGRILPKDGLRPYLGPAVGDFPPDVRDADAAGNLAVIDVVAVAANHRRQGIGFTLLRATHDALVGAGADKLLVTFKRGPRAAPSRASCVAWASRSGASSRPTGATNAIAASSNASTARTAASARR